MKNLELRIEKKELRVVRRTCQFLILNSKFLICCVSLLFCSNAMADSLKFKFSPGDKYSLVSVTEQRMARVMDGNERVAEQTTQIECDFDIKEVDEAGFAWGEYAYRRTIMKVKSPELNFVFDSDANQSRMPIQAIPLRLVVGEELYLRITPQGRIEKINGLQALITSCKTRNPSFANAGIINQAIDRRFAEPTIRRELEDQLRVFPEPALRSLPVLHSPGEGGSEAGSNEGEVTWSRTYILSSAEVGYSKVEHVEEVNIVFEKTFRLNPDKSGKGGIAVVDVNLVIKPACAPVLSTPPERDGQAQASESSVRANKEISGSGTGQIEIEEATGRIISSKMTQDMTEGIKYIYITQGPMLRLPPSPEPIITHTVTTFQMTKVEGAKPARPADANEKGA